MKQRKLSICNFLVIFLVLGTVAWLLLVGVLLVRIRSKSLQAQPSATSTSNFRISTLSSDPIGFDASISANVAVEKDIHIAFSTDCSFFQDWQTLLVFHSAALVNQRGTITRIASGCSPERQKELIETYLELFPQYNIHFTPDFKTDSLTKKKYDFYNKPFGVLHWLENYDKGKYLMNKSDIIAIIDPDFIFLRPLDEHLDEGLGLFSTTSELVSSVEQFHPAAQLYGLGAPWATDKRKNDELNRTRICGANSPCLAVSQKEGEQFYRYDRSFNGYFVSIIIIVFCFLVLDLLIW